VTDLLVTTGEGRHVLGHRGKALDKIMAEQNFSNSEREPDIGCKLESPRRRRDHRRQHHRVRQRHQNKGVGGIGGGLGKMVSAAIRKESKAIVGLDARIVDIDTAKSSRSPKQGRIQADQHVNARRRGSWGGFGAGAVNFGSSDFQNTIIGEYEAATEQPSTNVIAGNGKLVVRTVVVEGLVAAADGADRPQRRR
jgi:hypothetical protein